MQDPPWKWSDSGKWSDCGNYGSGQTVGADVDRGKWSDCGDYGSAEQPKVKKRRISPSPGSSSSSYSTGDVCVEVTTNVAFITCGPDTVLETKEERAILKQKLAEMFDLGCTMFCFSFKRRVHMKKVAESMKRHLGSKYDMEVGGLHYTQNSLCLWLPEFGKCLVSKIMDQEPDLSMPRLQMAAHLFETDAGNVLVIPTVWPPRRSIR